MEPLTSRERDLYAPFIKKLQDDMNSIAETALRPLRRQLDNALTVWRTWIG